MPSLSTSNSPINNILSDKLLPLTLSHPHNNQSSITISAFQHHFSTSTNIWLPKRNQTFRKMAWFPFISPSFHPEFCFKTAPLYSPSNDSCAAMEHATCQQQKSKVYSSVTNLSLWTATPQNITPTKSLLCTLKDTRHYPTNSSRRHKRIMQEVDAWNEPISPISVHSAFCPAFSCSHKPRSQQPLLQSPQPTNKLHTEA